VITRKITYNEQGTCQACSDKFGLNDIMTYFLIATTSAAVAQPLALIEMNWSFS
jgi:hypothetical protein